MSQSVENQARTSTNLTVELKYETTSRCGAFKFGSRVDEVFLEKMMIWDGRGKWGAPNHGTAGISAFFKLLARLVAIGTSRLVGVQRRSVLVQSMAKPFVHHNPILSHREGDVKYQSQHATPSRLDPFGSLDPLIRPRLQRHFAPPHLVFSPVSDQSPDSLCE